jgi:hypothetical protein
MVRHGSSYHTQLAYPRVESIAHVCGDRIRLPAEHNARHRTAPDALREPHWLPIGGTDFWGISFAFSSIDHQVMSGEELERELTLMRACWTFFDAVRARVSAEMQRGPRGGGRDRDHIVRHTLFVEKDWASGVGVTTPDEEPLTDEGLTAYRNAYCQAIRDYHAQGKQAGKQAKWPLRFLIRHTAFHTLDHAWEMEDKDLTGK